MIPARDKRTVFLHEIAIYSVAVPAIFIFTGVPGLWFFVFQAIGHLVGAFISNKFYWWYGRPSTLVAGRILMIATAALWIIAGDTVAAK